MLDQFPALHEHGYESTSPATIKYNCIAWAADDNTGWWEPDPFGLFLWPPSVAREWTIDSIVAAFETLDYGCCEHGDLEQQQEKIAIYVHPSGEPTHVAWQMDDGRWSSKLGEGKDIIHTTLEGLVGELYGTAKTYMKRRRKGRNAI